MIVQNWFTIMHLHFRYVISYILIISAKLPWGNRDNPTTSNHVHSTKIKCAHLEMTEIGEYFFLEKLVLLYSKGTLIWIKMTLKTFIMLQKFYLLNTVLVNLKPKTKMVIVVLLNIFVETFSNIDKNKKCFLSSRSAYENDFWRIMWHWRL